MIKKRPASSGLQKHLKSLEGTKKSKGPEGSLQQTKTFSNKLISQTQTAHLLRNFPLLHSKPFPLKSKQIFLNGLSLNQWKAITNFSIAGQSNKKKKNFNIAIEHYFNLKSMYRKINSIKVKPSLYSIPSHPPLVLPSKTKGLSQLAS